VTEEEEFLGTVRDSLGDMVGRFNINSGLMAVLQSRLEGLLLEHQQRSPTSLGYQDWALLKLWFFSQGGRLEDDGKLYSETDELIGTIDRSTVKRKVTVEVDEEDPTKINYALFDYTIVLVHPIEMITLTITLNDSEED
jgi:hypothetical protein